MIKRKLTLLALSVIAASSLLTGCGGGSSSAPTTTTTPPSAPPSTSPAPSTPPTSGTNNTTPAAPAGLTTPQYAANSAELEMFTKINAYRTSCGFPAVQENTTLDTASANHVSYMQKNGGLITDTEVAGNPGFTGTTYLARAIAQGWPSTGYFVGGGSGGYYTNTNLTLAQYGDKIINAWAGGVYHQQIIAAPVSLIGFGFGQVPYNGFPQVTGTISFGIATPVTAGSAPLTFPCQGVTGVPYISNGEMPVPPNTSIYGWGTPITVMGNPNDSVTLTSGSITDPLNNVIPLNLLDSGTDPNRVLGMNTAVAYPSAQLNPNTTYTVNLSGAMNGAPFTKTFTFTTGK